MPKFIRKHPWFFVWTTVILLATLSLVAGIRLSVDTSIVNQLQHYTQTTRTNDMFNPIVVYDDTGFIEIEVTLPHLTLIGGDPMQDCSDMWVSYWRIANPITSVYDWIDRGVFIDDFIIWGAELDSYCDNADPTNTWYTHFYRMWNVPTVAEGFTYVIYLDFYDADCVRWSCDYAELLLEDVWQQMSINEQGEFPPDEEVQASLLECDLISFFEYQEHVPDDVDYTPPTATPTQPPTNGNGDGNGPLAGGWMNQYDIFPSMQNWVFLIILVLLFGLIGLIIFIIIYYKKKDKKKK